LAEPAFVSDPLVQRWQAKLLKKAKATARVYGEFLYTYFSKVLRPRGVANLSHWFEELRGEHESKDVQVRQRWASDLEDFVTSYVSPTTGKKYTYKSRKLFVTGVRSFLQFHLGRTSLEPYTFDLQSSEERLKAEKEKEETKPISVEEYRKLVYGAKSVRDKTILLTLASGMGVSEWLQFAHEWWKYAKAIREKKVPIVVSVVRPKTARHYKVWLWDDSVEHLGLLLQVRETELGRPLTPNDQLFINATGGTLVNHRVQHMIRTLAADLGLEPREHGKILYRIRPHELGRDFFRTLCENADVPATVAEYSLGHKIDPMEYNKFQNTPEGQSKIETTLSRLRPYVNAVSGKGEKLLHAGSYFDQTAETLAVTKALDQDRVERHLEYEAQKLQAYKVVEERVKKSMLYMAGVNTEKIEPKEICRAMTKEELFPAVVATARALSDPTPAKTEDKVIPEEELQSYLTKGWQFLSVVNTKHVVVRRTTTEDFDQPGASKVGA
jgi:site-specific recombinase XerD